MPGEVTIPLYQATLRVVMDWVHEQLRQLREAKMDRMATHISKMFRAYRARAIVNWRLLIWFRNGIRRPMNFDEYRRYKLNYPNDGPAFMTIYM